MAVQSHRELCNLAVRWLKRPNSAGGHGCIVALSECRPEARGESPDAIGFRAGWQDGSVLVECKVSRSDFLADKAKPYRQSGGMGTWRYYMAPEGVIRTDDLPAKWGLLLVNNRGHVKPVAGPAAAARGRHSDFLEALEAYRHEDTDIERERALLVRVMARVGDVEAMNRQIRDAMAAQQRLADELIRQRQAKRDLGSRLMVLQMRIEAMRESGDPQLVREALDAVGPLWWE